MIMRAFVPHDTARLVVHQPSIRTTIKATRSCVSIAHRIVPLASQRTWLTWTLHPLPCCICISPVCRDAVLLELTFVSIWLAQFLPSLQPAASNSLGLQPPPQQLSVNTHSVRAQPAALFLRWLLFKVLLLSSSSKTNIVCSAVRGVTNCHRAMIAHGQPSIFSW